MVSIKLKFRPSTVKGKEGSLFYQVICARIVRQVSTKYKIMTHEWDHENNKLIIHTENQQRYDYLSLIQYKIDWDMKRFKHIVNRLSTQNISFNANNIVNEFLDCNSEITVFNYIQKLIEALWKQKQYRTSETYSVTLNSFRKFRNGIDLYFEDMNSNLLISYEYYLKGKTLAPNTISFYMKRLRAIYNKAVDDEYTVNKYPFRRVFTSSEKTVKRAIQLKYIRMIKKLDLSHCASKCFARDMFLFSFYMRGMSFIDIAYLKKKDLIGHTLTYRRKKTGQLMKINWEPCMQEIIEKYPSDSMSPYLLPIIANPKGDIRKQYYNAQALVNRNLKKIGKELNIYIPLTMYCARHSWATIARYEGIPLAIISEGMGHDSERTTQIYLASIASQSIDRANRKILKLL